MLKGNSNYQFSNSIYVGIVLMAPITNQKRYEAVLNEILQYLSTKSANINVQVQPNRFITFYSINGNISDQICLPLSPLYLHTCYFRLHQGFQLQDEDKVFASISWEVLNILKENFPSKIYLHQENLELCQGDGKIFTTMSQNEELRRQTSCLLSIKDDARPLTLDELEDAWHTLQYAEKIGDIKAQNTCLELISQSVPHQLLISIKNSVDLETLKRITEKGGDYSQLSSNKQIAQELLTKMEQQNDKDSTVIDTTLQRQLNELNSCDDDSLSINGGGGTGQVQANNNFERPTSTRMCLFQLSESNDLNRVTLILDTLSNRSKETLSQMRKKYNLSAKLIQILKKYCNGDYGFDQQSSRHGHFQYNLLKLLIILSQDYAVFLEYLESQALDFLCQILEEGVIFAYEDALAGDQSGQNDQLYLFLRGALDMVEMAVSKQFIEYVPSIRENLIKIQQRMCKLLSKKENAMLNYFIQQYSTAGSTYGTNQPLVINDGGVKINGGCEDNQYQLGMTTNSILNQTQQQQDQQSIQIDQLQELKAISLGLYQFAVKLSEQIQRIEALQDFNEQYEDKHRRLFYKIIGFKPITNNKNVNNNIQQTQYEDKLYQNEAAVQDMRPLDERRVRQGKVQFKGQVEQQQQQEDRYYEQKQFPIQDQNIKKNNQQQIYDNGDLQEYRNKIQKKQNKMSSKQIANKENEAHFIGGSPIKPYQKEIRGGEEQYGSNLTYKRNYNLK